jgi:hypothetical protein
MRSDLISKRLFTAGCFGLPWLWTVHCLYHWKGSGAGDDQENDEALLNPDDRESTLLLAFLLDSLVSTGCVWFFMDVP